MSDAFKLTDLVDRVSTRRPPHAKFLGEAFRLLTNEEKIEADSYLAYMIKDHDPNYLVESYETIVDDTSDAQLFFAREGRYRCSTFEEVANSVYFNDEYMKKYMVGLAITSFVWPNHTYIRRFFRDTFPTGRSGTYLEVGPGHGLSLIEAIRSGNLDQYVGVDISATSLNLTRDVIRFFCPSDFERVSLIQSDFLAGKDFGENFDILVMGEVLEHVEQPKAFLARLRTLAAPNAHIFVTTCVNAPAIDHIYLFSSEKQVEAEIAESGLSIRKRLAVPYFGKTIEESVAQRLPINVAYVLAP